MLRAACREPDMRRQSAVRAAVRCGDAGETALIDANVQASMKATDSLVEPRPSSTRHRSITQLAHASMP